MIYVIRHGQTSLNLERKYNSIIDEDINERGIEQAKMAASQIKDLHIDIAYCSPLLRTRHTFELLGLTNVPVFYDDRIIERDAGELTGQVKTDENFEIFNSMTRENEIKGCESTDNVFSRVKSLLNEIKVTYADKNILLVTHGGVARVIYYCFNDIPEDKNLGRYIAENCNVASYDLKNLRN